MYRYGPAHKRKKDKNERKGRGAQLNQLLKLVNISIVAAGGLLAAKFTFWHKFKKSFQQFLNGWQM